MIASKLCNCNYHSTLDMPQQFSPLSSEDTLIRRDKNIHWFKFRHPQSKPIIFLQNNNNFIQISLKYQVVHLLN